MKLKAMFLMFVFSLLAFAGVALAGTGLQTTPFETPQFSATFNSTVTLQPASRSKDNQSTNYVYTSYSDTNMISQAVIVRFIDHDIDVNYTSSDFYANDDTSTGTISNTSNGTYQGHPFTYTARKWSEGGMADLIKRTRFIVVNSREVIFIIQIAPDTNRSYGDREQWMEFKNSLNIK
jgi:hypothetical protein